VIVLVAIVLALLLLALVVADCWRINRRRDAGRGAL
jgi:hypothetical protein